MPNGWLKVPHPKGEALGLGSFHVRSYGPAGASYRMQWGAPLPVLANASVHTPLPPSRVRELRLREPQGA